MKKCSRCKSIKQEDDFGIDKARKDGKNCWCKGCIQKRSRSVAEKIKNDPSLRVRINERRNKLRKENPEKYRRESYVYWEKNKEKFREYERERQKKKKYYKNRPKEKANNCARRYRERHPEKIKAMRCSERGRAYQRQWIKQKIEKDPQYKINRAISRGVNSSLKKNKKGLSWETLLGYTILDLTAHLEKQFQPGMTLENHGSWHIDHIIPLSAFNFTSPQDLDFKRCWALSNLRPLWAKDNLSKNKKLSSPFQPSLALQMKDAPGA